jgi:hypothetical protein
MREMGIELKGFSRLTDLFTRLTDLLKEGMDGEVNISIASNQAGGTRCSAACCPGPRATGSCGPRSPSGTRKTTRPWPVG